MSQSDLNIADQPQAIDLATARQLFENGQATLYDIREPQEHANGVIAGTKLLPLSQLEAQLDTLPRDAQTPLMFICETQGRSAHLATVLHQAGWKNCAFVIGGIQQWRHLGWPLTQPNET